MILDKNNPMYKRTKIYDCRGGFIGRVERYHTETKEITMAHKLYRCSQDIDCLSVNDYIKE